MGESTIADFEKEMMEILEDLMQDWDTEFDGGIHSETRLVVNLGFESLDVVHLITAIEQRYGKTDFPFEELLMVEGAYVDDLTVRQISEFVHRYMNESNSP